MHIKRRAFLKSMGLIGLGSVTACNSAPLEKLYAYLTPPENITPGIAAYYSTVCRACPAGCGIMVKTREARPIKLEGNPDHPVNRGALCIRGQAFIQSLYSRYRVQAPMLRKNGTLETVSWKEAMAVVANKLKDAKRVALLTGLESGSFETLSSEFLSAWPDSPHVQYEPVAFASAATATELLTGIRAVPRYHIDKARYVLSLGADILDAWASPVEYARQWSNGHGIKEQTRSLALEYVGPRLNLTANAADRYHILPVHSLPSLSLAILHDVFSRTRRKLPEETVKLIQSILSRLGPRPSTFELSVSGLDKIVNKLVAAPNSLMMFGGNEVTDANATAMHTVVYLINYLIGANGKTVTYTPSYMYGKLTPDAQVAELLTATSKGAYDILFNFGTNPAYTMPGPLKIAEKLQQNPFVVSLAWEHNETTELADVILPVHHPLESWGDYEVSSETVGIMQPVRSPLYKTRLAGDLLIELSAAADKPMKQPTYKDYVIQRWSKRSGFAPMAATESLDEISNTPVVGAAPVQAPTWEETLVKGGLFIGAKPDATSLPQLTGASVDKIPPLATGKHTGLSLIAPMSAALYDGRGSSLDWLMEIPDSLMQTAWEVPAELPSNLATSLKIKDGDTITITSGEVSIDATAIVNNTLANDTIALRMGGNRKFNGATGFRSGNVMALLSGNNDPISGQFARVQSQIQVQKNAEGHITSVMGSSYSEDRYLCLSMNHADLKKNRYPYMTRHGDHSAVSPEKAKAHILPMPHDEVRDKHPHDNITALQEHPDHRWGITVDLDKCIGCASCVAACYAENNIPTVGKQEVSRGRELSWLRIEKHVIQNEADKERIRFLPVMCQHCDNAPCETVCPVFASHHTPDGLNAQIYNRCIGTRYCANNCPYKVRRFNYFDYDREQPGNQQLNPDVTVRSRGVMEKCTFCIQRIREATNRAKVENRPLRDDEITPACVQTCPTQALTFGDYKQQDAPMSTLARDRRGYRLLDYMTNTRPGVVYLRKVYSDPEEV